MKRKLRIWLTLSVAIYFSWGTSADTQSPPQDLPPWGLTSALDAQVLSVQLTQAAAQLQSGLSGTGEIHDLTFLPVVATPTQVVYLTTAREVPGGAIASAPAFVTSAPAAISQLHNFCYVHEIGSNCQMPPDQIFHSATPRTFTPRAPRNRIQNIEQLEFLAFAMQGWSGTSTTPALLNLATLWTTSPTIVLQNFEIRQSGNNFTLIFELLDTALSTKKTTHRWVYARRNQNGDFGQVVVR